MVRRRHHLRLSLQSNLTFAILAVAAVSAACGSSTGSPAASADDRKDIVVTYSVLGAVVKDLVGDTANVTVLMPNGADPHEWEPSARDIETLTRADLLVENGLGLEGGMTDAFGRAEAAGVKRFVASDHITIRRVGPGEGADPADADQAPGAEDPHLWMDPLTVRDVVDALAVQLKADLGIDVADRATDLGKRLAILNDQVTEQVAVVPEARRTLVTGHESLGYFAERFGFRLIGAIIPSITTSAEPSAAVLAALSERVREEQVPAIFTELGTSPAVAEAVGSATGAKVVELSTHLLPEDGSYDTFVKNFAGLIADNLR